MPQLGCRLSRSRFDSDEVVDWSLRRVFRTRIYFEGYRVEFFPVPFESKLQLFSIRQVSSTACQKVVSVGLQKLAKNDKVAGSFYTKLTVARANEPARVH